MNEYKDEVRFMRALFYYNALDFYRKIPMVTENDTVGSYIPPRYTPQQTFDYIDVRPAGHPPVGPVDRGSAALQALSGGPEDPVFGW